MKDITYLKTKSATILWLIKIGIGLMAVYAVCVTIKPMIPVLQEYLKMTGSIRDGIAEYWQYVMDYFERLNIMLEQFQLHIDPSNLFFLINAVALFSYMAISPIFTIMEAVGSTLIRFKNSGTALVKFSQGVKTGVGLFFMVDLIVLLIVFVRSREQFSEEIFAGGLLVIGVTAVLLFLLVCYCMDIVHAMTAVSENMEQGPAEIKKTHLSGLSIFWGLVWTLVLVLLLFLAGAYMKSNVGTPLWLEIVETAAMAVKHFLVAACNRKIKRFNRQTQN